MLCKVRAVKVSPIQIQHKNTWRRKNKKKEGWK